MSKILRVFLVILSVMLLLTSCASIGDLLKAPNKVRMVYYVDNIGADESVSETPYSELRKLNNIYSSRMTSDYVMKSIAEEVGFCSAEEIRSMISVEYDDKAVLFEATFSSRTYSYDALFQIADEYEDYVNASIGISGGSSRIVMVEAPHIC